jgi:hypothetical protein
MRSSKFRFRLVVVSLVMPLLLSCADDSQQGSGEVVDIDEQAVLEAAAHYRDGSQFDRVSGSSYPSALGTTSYIDLYASRTASMQYALIDPAASGSNALVPVGGIIVREVLDENTKPQRLTILAKGPAGYNPTIGDWFWAVTDLNGTPIVENGVPRTGRLADCYGCHVPRAADDYLFGVPLVDRGTGTNDGDGTNDGGSGSGSGSGTPSGGTHAVCGDFACEGGETKATCPQDCNHGHMNLQ